MATNRKRPANAVRMRQLAKILLLAGACAAVGLGYVWQKNQIYRLGREIKQREIAVDDAKRHNMLLSASVAQLKSPAALEGRIRALNINLVTPKNSQIIRLREPSDSAPMAPPPAPPAAQPANQQQIAARPAPARTAPATRPPTQTTPRRQP